MMVVATAIRAWLSDQEARLLELLEGLVVTESHASHPAGVAAVADIVIGELSPLGFRFESTPAPSLPAGQHWLEELFSPGVPYDRLGSTYAASASGNLPGRLLLLGDLDTAFPVGTIDTVPFRIEDGRAFGPGIADMKGGLVVLITALQALHHLGVDYPEIALVLSGDEQAGSLGSRPVIERLGDGADWCLCVECARRGGKLMAARGHIGVGILEITGLEAHTGSARSAGINALEVLAHVILEFNALSEPQRGTLVTVTIARAGRRRSIVPARAEATVDIRTRSPADWADVTARMESIAERAADTTDATVGLHMYNHRPGFVQDDGTDRLLDLARAVGEELGFEIDSFASAAAGSSAFRHPGTATLDGLGPVGADLMTEHEHIDIASLVPRAALLAGLIHRLSRS